MSGDMERAMGDAAAHHYAWLHCEFPIGWKIIEEMQ